MQVVDFKNQVYNKTNKNVQLNESNSKSELPICFEVEHVNYNNIIMLSVLTV